jgi:hypothetical protein
MEKDAKRQVREKEEKQAKARQASRDKIAKA